MLPAPVSWPFNVCLKPCNVLRDLATASSDKLSTWLLIASVTAGGSPANFGGCLGSTEVGGPRKYAGAGVAGFGPGVYVFGGALGDGGALGIGLSDTGSSSNVTLLLLMPAVVAVFPIGIVLTTGTCIIRDCGLMSAAGTV